MPPKTAYVGSLLMLAVACGGAKPASNDVVPTASASLELDRDDLVDRHASEELLRKLDASPYAYFRFINEPFSQRVCEAFRDKRWEMPTVMVHGDAHLEQFVVTESTYGLEDFDHSGLGPAVIDLVRFATSIYLACEVNEWACDPNVAVAAFLSAYREAIDDPPLPADPPPVVERLRAQSQQRPDFQLWAESLMLPLSPEEVAAAKRDWERFVSLLLEVQPLDRDFFEIKKMGDLNMGIGGALDRKLLFRVRGPTNAADDDLVLEAKLQNPPQNVECVIIPPAGGMLRPLAATARIGRRLPEVFGYVPVPQRGERPLHFWVQAWDPGYQELSVADLQSQDELDQIAKDAGLQLGRAASSLTPDVLLPQHHYACLQAFDMTEARVVETAKLLAAEVTAAWEQFREE